MITELVLAHHPLLTAVPFVVPAVLLAGAVGAVVWRDRRDDGPHDLSELDPPA